MRRVLFDINVVLDVLLDRHPHVAPSAAMWAAVEDGRVEGLLAAHAVTTIHYFVRKEMSPPKAIDTVSAILRVFAVAAIDLSVIREALQLSCPDFEDAVTAASARAAGCEYILTRDPKGFRGSPVRVLTPEAAVPFFQGSR